jgi:DNA repair protein RadC
MAIHEWPEGERPREKLSRAGPEALSEAELLAIFLRVGVRGMSAIDLARVLLGRFGSLRGLAAAPVEAIADVRGMGLAKSTQFKAAVEMAKRALGEAARERSALTSPDAVRQFLRLELEPRERECFLVVHLDAQHRVIACDELFAGTLTQTSVYPREVVKAALRHNAAAVIFAHNHPSGVAEPSQADRLLTEALRKALALVDVRVLDHLVVGVGGTTSFAERGLL